jgi:hypothetical protein
VPSKAKNEKSKNKNDGAQERDPPDKIGGGSGC